VAAHVILFKKESTLISRAIAKVTKCDITHSAVLFDGALFDASEIRGEFGRAKIKKLQNRKVEAYHLGASEAQVETWLVMNHGKKYDYSGVLQWLLFGLFGRFFKKTRLNQRSKVYCFEATASLINKVTGLKYPQNISGDHLRRTLGRAVFKGQLKEFLNDA